MKTLIFLFLCVNANAVELIPYAPSTVSNDAAYVNVTGDTMSGPLTLNGSSLTVTGNAFSVGGSTLVVTGGMLGIGLSPAVPLNIGGTFTKYGALIIAPTATAALGVQRAIGVAGTQIPAANSDEIFGLTLNQTITNGGGYTSVNGYGVNIEDPGGTVGVVNTWKSLNIATPTKGTTNHAIYVAGGNSYFGGHVGIAVTAPSEALEVAGGIASYSRTMAQLLAITPSQVGVQYFCNNCTPAKMVVSTGTAAGNFAGIMGGTFE